LQNLARSDSAVLARNGQSRGMSFDIEEFSKMWKKLWNIKAPSKQDADYSTVICTRLLTSWNAFAMLQYPHV
jgi:hypothetical protein